MPQSMDDRLRDALKESLRVRRKLEARIEALEASRVEPIAVIGMAYRIPGAESDNLWALLDEGREALGPLPKDRSWTPLKDPLGRFELEQGSFLTDIWSFDAEFFGWAPMMVDYTNPERRLAAECAWEALEDAGIVPDARRGTRGGIYVGLTYNTFAGMVDYTPDTQPGIVAGNTRASAAGALSYLFGWEGPAMTVDTACSSALVSVHLAVEGLRSGACDVALAGGATVAASSATHQFLLLQDGLSPDGRCHSFSETANGTAFSEGVGWVVLKRLSDALRDGDRIDAVIRGSAVNQDGRSNGITAPNGPSQERCILAAIRDTGLTPQDIDAVEAHGTGTVLGDPIEANAILATYGKERETPLYLGSLKSNVGHMQAAAGVGGLIKMVLALKHESLPKTLHVSEPSTKIDWTAGKMQVLREAVPWPRGPRVRRAGVSSFGITGTNAHVVIEEAPATPQREAASDVTHALPLIVCGRSEAALQDQAGRLAAHLRQRPSLSLADVAYSLATTRSPFAHRLALPVTADTRHVDVIEALETYAAQGRLPRLATQARAGNRSVGMWFTGQGSQHGGMGKGLYDTFPAFRASFDACCAALAPHVTLPSGFATLQALVFDAAADEHLAATELTQPALFALEVAQSHLWASLGVVPEVVAGHSIGELVAAHIAGVFSLEDAARLVAARGALMKSHAASGGTMVVIGAAEAEVRAVVDRVDDVCIAVINGPEQTVVSGRPSAVDAVVRQLSGHRTRQLKVSHAFHSADLDGMLAAFRVVAETVSYRQPTCRVVSGLTGRLAEAGDLVTAEYWVRQVRQAVRFGDVISTTEQLGLSVVVECGPAAVLTAMAAESTLTCVSTSRRDEDDALSLASALGGAICAGLEPKGIFEILGGRRVALPKVAFQRKQYMPATTRGSASAWSLGLQVSGHPILRATTAVGDGKEMVWTGFLSPTAPEWVADHAIYGRVLYPGVGILELVWEALEQGRAAGAEGAVSVDELVLESPLVVPEQGVAVQVVLDTDTVRVFSRAAEDQGWTRHASGRWSLTSRAPAAAPVWPPEGATPVDVAGLHEELRAVGYGYGPAFQGLTSAYREASGVIWAEVHLPEGVSPKGLGLHPALLDGSLHAPLAVLRGASGAQQVELPFGFAEAVLWRRDAVALYVRLAPEGTSGPQLSAWTPSGSAVVEIETFWRRPAQATQLDQASSVQHLYTLDWQAQEASEKTWPAGDEVVLMRTAESLSPTADALAAALRAQGISVTTLGVDALCPEGLRDAVWVVDWATPSDDALPARAQHMVQAGLEQLQAVIASEPRRLVWLTSGALSLRGDSMETDPAQRALWGLGRTCRSEHPTLPFGMVDVDTGASPLVLARAVRWDEEGQVALRGDVCHAPRLVPAAVDPSRESTGVEGGMALITGAGELGRLTAEHLVSTHGVREVLLASRRGMASPATAETVAALKALGAERVEAVACDVTQPADVAALAARVASTDTPLRYVVHTAGLLRDTMLHNLTAAQLSDVMAPKVSGALQVVEAIRPHAPGAQYVFFSSFAGVQGSSGQGNYAAANQFLDGYAERLRAQGEAAVSLSWGLWDRGELVDEDQLTRLMSRGARRMGPAVGMALFDAALSTGLPHLVPVELDTARLQSAWDRGARSPLFSRLVRHRYEEVPQQEAPRSRSQLVALVREIVASILGAGRAQDIPLDRSFQELGVESMMAVEIRNALAAATGQKLPATLLFDYPTVQDLVGLLWKGKEVPPERVAPISRGDEEKIAIVGYACRFPGADEGAEALWELLRTGGEGIGPLPTDRYWPSAEELHDPTGERPGSSVTAEGGFLRDVGHFEPSFFGVSPREALGMDPQHRLVLECAWESLEHAGLVPAALRGGRGGVFLGLYDGGYTPGGGLGGHVGTGGSGSVASGRVAYTLGWEGPAVTVDTACSASLVSVHLGCRSLRHGESDVVLAGGVGVMSSAGLYIEFSRQGGLSPDGRCRAFGEGAAGTGFSDGVGFVVLKRLSDAQRDGDRIYGLVLGSAMNQDGRSNGMTAPNGPSQERVIRDALASANLQYADIDAVEAHGTGTVLGDPIEAQALMATYGQDRETPVYLGSLKSNVGHTQSAAGIGGLIKMLLAMEHELLPRTLHCEEPNSKVDWTAGKVALLHEAVPWPRGTRVRRAGVSAFSISGTNAHVVIEEPPLAEAAPVELGPSCIPVVVTSKTAAGLQAQAARLAEYLYERPELSVRDVAFSQGTTRSAFMHRLGMTVSTDADATVLAGQLQQFAETDVMPRGAVTGMASDGPVALWFTGQGSQRGGMGAGLYAAYPAFADALDACSEALTPHVALPDGYATLRALMFDADAGELLSRTELTQPALFALEVALARLWASLGVEPELVAGHSIGELVAAHVAGVFGLEDAARLVAARGALMASHAVAGGRMAAVGAPEDVVRAVVQAHEGACIAVVNGPSQTVVSGRPEAVEAVVAELDAYRVRWLTVSHAFHSADLDGMLEAFRDVAASVTYRAPQCQVISGLTGQLATGDDLVTADYWVRQVREAVRFGDVIAKTADTYLSVVLECGPAAVLTAMAGDADLRAVSSLRREQDEVEAFAAALAAAMCGGVSPRSVLHALGGRRVVLPTVAFQRERYWPEALASNASAHTLGLESSLHAVLRARTMVGPRQGSLHTGSLSTSAPGWVKDHAIYEQVLYPGVGLLELAWTAIEQSRPPGAIGVAKVDELVLAAPLVVPASGVAVQVWIEEQAVTILSRSAESDVWATHATGTWSWTTDKPGTLGAWPPPAAEAIDVGGLYEVLAAMGYGYGPSFHGLTGAWREPSGVLWASLQLPREAGDTSGYGLHPALLDSALHVQLAAFEDAEGPAQVRLPFGFGEAVLWSRDATTLYLRLDPDGSSSEPQLQAWTPGGTPVVQIAALWSRPASPQQVSTDAPLQHLYHLDWEELGPAPTVDTNIPSVVMIAASGALSDLGQRLVSSMQDKGMPVSVCTSPDLLPVDAQDAMWVVDWASLTATDLVVKTHDGTTRALAQLQRVADAAPARLVWLTTGAWALLEDAHGVDAGQRALWGLGRTLFSEHPDVSFGLIDSAPDADVEAVLGVIAARDAMALAVRGGSIWGARLVRGAPDTGVVESTGTAAVVMGSGVLGRLTAEHLVTRYGVTHVVLASRRGEASAGIAETVASLESLGAGQVEVVAVDVSDRDAVGALAADLAGRDVDLGYVVHTAGVLRDGVLSGMTPDALGAVLTPKVNGVVAVTDAFRARFTGAHYLLYSSVTGVLGAPGQGNYAAANQFLDGYAAWLRSHGERATSLAWGLWDRGEMLASMSDADRARISQGFVRPLDGVTGMRVLDLALATGGVNLVPIHLDITSLQGAWDAGTRLPMFSRLVRHRAEPIVVTEVPRTREQVVALIRDIVAGAVGLMGGSAVPLDQAFETLGVDSLMAVEIRNRLMQATGQSLPATLMFDYPTVEAMADLLAPDEVEAEPESQLVDWEAVRALPDAVLEQSGVIELLQSLLTEDSTDLSEDDFLADMESFLMPDVDP